MGSMVERCNPSLLQLASLRGGNALVCFSHGAKNLLHAYKDQGIQSTTVRNACPV